MVEVLRTHVEDHLSMLNRWAYKLLKKKVLVHPVDVTACELMIRTSGELGLLAIEWLKRKTNHGHHHRGITNPPFRVKSANPQFGVCECRSQIAAETFLESARLFVSESQWADNSSERLEMLEKNSLQ